MRHVAAFVRSPLADFLALQAGWWAAAGGAAIGWPLLGPVVIVPLLWAQSRALGAEERRRLAWAVAGLALLGTTLDSLLAAAGMVRFAGAWAAWPAPFWITALWAHFATALPALARLAAGRPWRLALLGAIGGPLAYWGGVRLGAASFPSGIAVGFLALAAEWAVVLPLTVRSVHGEQAVSTRIALDAAA